MSGPYLRTVATAEDGMRLDRWFKASFPDLSFSHLQKLLRSGQVRLDGKRVKGDQRVASGQVVRIPPLERAEPGVTPVASREEPRAESPGLHASSRAPRAPNPATSARRGGNAARGSSDAEFLRQILLHEDRDVLVFNKPFGLAVQGGSGLSRHIDGMLPALTSQRGDVPRLVHRLDRDTTGVLVVAKTRKAAAEISAAFRARATKKIYWSLLYGVPRVRQGRISTFLAKGADEKGDQKMHVAKQGGDADHALTYYAVVDQAAQKASWVSLRPVTGRTHQLRVHTAEMGHPIIGDPKYFNIENWQLPGGVQNRLHLHARRIVMPLPSGDILDVSAPLPDHMRQSWNLLGFDPDQYDPIEDAPER
jgi:23S rRNA pseudouridine955/2504/2580 synthase